MMQPCPLDDLEAAFRHAELLTGSRDTKMHARCIHDQNRKAPAHKLFGNIENLWAEMQAKQEAGYGVFIVVNEGGDTDTAIINVRAVFVDADDVPLPTTWHVAPDFFVQRDATHWHAYWRVLDLAPADFSRIQKRLAAHYGTDPAVCNLSRVMRLAGTLHQKGKPVTITLIDRTNGLDAALLGHGVAELSEGLSATVPEATERPSLRRGEPVDETFLREALSFLEPDSPYPQWRDVVAAIGAANCPDAAQIAHEWSLGKLDCKKRYEGNYPVRYNGPEPVDQVLATMPPKEDGIGPGSIARLAMEAGWKGTLSPSPRAQEIFGSFAQQIMDDEVGGANDAKWRFATCDPVADANAPPISYRDDNKLWPNSPERTVTQVIAGAKCHKTNWIMAEMFRLMRNASARVLMLPLEGAYGVRTARLKALAEYYSVPLADLRGRFQVAKVTTGGMFDLSDPECTAGFASWVKGKWDCVLIDTQHRAAGRLEENSATDARTLWNAVEGIRRGGDCDVTLLHHTGKDTSKGGRGSSADLASVDQQIELTFDRASMTVAAKVTARKDGPDGFTVPFKVYQPSPNAVPILLPISTVEFESLVARQDRITPDMIGAALREMECVGRTKAVTTHALAFQILQTLDAMPTDAEAAEKAVNSLRNRILERAAKDTRIAAYGQKDGQHRTASWFWYLPEGGREEWSDV
jgi:hypothetical protein